MLLTLCKDYFNHYIFLFSPLKHPSRLRSMHASYIYVANTSRSARATVAKNSRTSSNSSLTSLRRGYLDPSGPTLLRLQATRGSHHLRRARRPWQNTVPLLSPGVFGHKIANSNYFLIGRPDVHSEPCPAKKDAKTGHQHTAAGQNRDIKIRVT